MDKSGTIIEVWSDIACPFCYMGKKKLEKVLAGFPGGEKVSIVFKSFQLQPDLVTEPGSSLEEYLAEARGIELSKVRAMNARIAESGRELGIDFNFNEAKVANTFRAHILLHYALRQGLQAEVKEALMKAFFVEGKNVDDTRVLNAIAKEAGLNTESLADAYEDENIINQVREDFYEAQQYGIRGVPFFLFGRRYAVSGAREPAVFNEALEKMFSGIK